VTFALRQRAVRAILLDIEGTTTPVAFVYEVLFPFARQHLRSYLRDPAHRETVCDVLARLRVEWDGDAAARAALPAWREADPESAAAYVDWLMARDVKSPALKLLQGHIWEGGYRSGALRGQVFPDVPPAFARWRGEGVTVAIYSSGSVLAQQLLFGATAAGDLTSFISAFFDTGVGAKRRPDSYRTIAAALQCAGAHILFVSDTPAELDAARTAGFQVALAVRPGNQPVDYPEADTIRTFEQIV
jgi:enolase-phosphatase E1